MESWRLLISPPDCGATNLATDQAVAESVRDGSSPPTLRFYTWRPRALSLGYTQPIGIVDLDLAKRLRIDIVRRPTGGQAILHDDELTYAIALPPKHTLAAGGVLASYERLNHGFERGLTTLGLDVVRGRWEPDTLSSFDMVCFQSPSTHELSSAGFKLIGSAQTRVSGALLQHGSLPFSHNPEICELLRLPRPDRWHGLRDLLPSPPTLGELAETMSTAFADTFNVAFHPSDLTPHERDQRDRLITERYRSHAWITRR